MYNNQNHLSTEQNEALLVAVALLIDRCIGDIRRLSAAQPLDEAETVLAAEEVLPPGFRPFYDLDFAERFHAVLMTVAWKLRSPHHYDLGCVAEEMAFHATIREAEHILEEIWERQQPETQWDETGEKYLALSLESFRDAANEDEDYELLWTDMFDMQDVDRENRLGIGGLRFTEWFSYFHETDWNVHLVAQWPNDWDWTEGPGMPPPPRA